MRTNLAPAAFATRATAPSWSLVATQKGFLAALFFLRFWMRAPGRIFLLFAIAFCNVCRQSAGFGG